MRAPSSPSFSKSGRALDSPSARSPQLLSAGGGGGSGTGSGDDRAPFSPKRECSASQWTNSRTARWLSQPPPASFPFSDATRDPHAPAPLRPRRKGDGSQAVCPAKGTSVSDWLLERLKPESRGRRAKFAPKGLLGYPCCGHRARTPGFNRPWSPGQRQTPGRSWRVFARRGERVPSRAPPEPQRLPPQLPASCARPSGPEVTSKHLDRQLGAQEAPAQPRGPEEGEKRGGRGYQASVSSNSAGRALARPGAPWLSLAAPAPALGSQPAAPSGPRLPWAPKRRRAGAAGQDTALLAPGAAGAPGRPQNREKWGGHPDPDTRNPGQPVPGLQAPERLPDPDPGAQAGLSQEQRGVRFIRNTEESAASAQLGTHAPARPHAPRRWPGRSPES